MAIVMVAAINSYFIRNPHGVMPGQGFLADFIEPFIELECLEAAIKGLTPHERELAKGRLMTLRHTCAERIGPKMPRDKPP